MYQKYFVKLTSEERSYLEKFISSGNAPARKLRRARILLKSDCSEGGPNWTDEAICDALDVNSLTVTNVRKAFTEGGLEQALNRKKPDREYEHRLDGKAEAHLLRWRAVKHPKDMSAGPCGFYRIVLSNWRLWRASRMRPSAPRSKKRT